MPSHDRATIFGEVAEDYARLRPGYPEEAFAEIRRFGRLRPGDRVLEVGAGTGIATAPLLDLGLRVLALEPSPEMAAVARRGLGGRPGFELSQRTFETWDPPGPGFRAVVSAQAWHWVDPDQRYLKAAAVLAPGGALALLWNRPGSGTPELTPALEEVYARLAPEISALPPGELDLDRRGEIRASGLFDRPRLRRFHFRVEYSGRSYRRLMETQSDHRLLPSPRRVRLLDAVEKVISGRGDRYLVEWVTLLYLARLLPGGDGFP